jgi:Zn-dependent protease
VLFGNPQQFIITSLYLIPGLLLGLVLHEWAHARVAVARGDETPRIDGRLSLDPSHHLDPLGTIAIFLIHFGWAKPVRINPAYMRHRFDPALVALAGPVMNLLIAVGISIPLRLLIGTYGNVATSAVAGGAYDILLRLLLAAFYLNVVLAVFNILPIPPLDGYNLVATFFRRRYPHFFYWVDGNRTIIMLVFVLVIFLVPGLLATIFLSVYGPVATWLLGAPYAPF